jgi:hypothetical protein
VQLPAGSTIKTGLLTKKATDTRAKARCAFSAESYTRGCV